MNQSQKPPLLREGMVWGRKRLQRRDAAAQAAAKTPKKSSKDERVLGESKFVGRVDSTFVDTFKMMPCVLIAPVS